MNTEARFKRLELEVGSTADLQSLLGIAHCQVRLAQRIARV
ncbi:hypothetical protein [Alicyclobacillus sp. ALC3]|nr:hypothetical protein [Alicyclobacillus sp. ALC3]